jgi:hypothetical protein
MANVHYNPGEKESSATSEGWTKRELLGDKVILTLSNYQVSFADLKDEHKQALARLVLDLHLGKPCAVATVSKVEGFTDATGDEALNTKLRELRANVAIGFLEGLVKQFNPDFDTTDNVHGAPMGTFLDSDQNTPSGRSRSRAARIELTRLHIQEFFQVKKPPDEFNKDQDTCGVVSVDPWKVREFTIGDVTVKGRPQWAARMLPLWEKEVVYYNTNLKPLVSFYEEIVIHHAANDDTLDKNERKEQERGFAAIGYHFAISQDGTIFMGRPMEVMGSHAGEGLKPGPMNDPDWGAVGIVLLGDFESRMGNFWSPDKPSDRMMASLENLINALRNEFTGIDVMALHREIPNRKGEPTVCPGSEAVGPLKALRSKLGMNAPGAP